jgi:hypothetical protein
MMDTGISTDSMTETIHHDGDHDRFAHYVYAPNGRASAIVTEAIVTGQALVALCGKRWVPSRDSARFPVCPDCKRIKSEVQGGETAA